MAKKISIETEKVSMEAELLETKTAKAIWDSLPIEAKVNTWGEEIYFTIPVDMGPEDAVDVVQEGDLGYCLKEMVSVFSLERLLFLQSQR